MVGGQVADLEGEHKALSLQELEKIHHNKTGRLLAFSVMAGGIIANAEEDEIKQLEKFAYHIGIAFQIQDDILDVEGTEELIGKPVGSDVSKEKSTYPRLLGMDGAKEKLQHHFQQALQSISNLNADTSLLDEFAELVVSRNH